MTVSQHAPLCIFNDVRRTVMLDLDIGWTLTLACFLGNGRKLNSMSEGSTNDRSFNNLHIFGELFSLINEMYNPRPRFDRRGYFFQVDIG